MDEHRSIAHIVKSKDVFRMIIGLTGSIASGKSTVSSMLKVKGYQIVDADIVAREVVQKGEPTLV